MHAVGEGVTRNFLTILEGDVRRSAKSLTQIGLVAALVLRLAFLSLQGFPAYGFLSIPLFFGAALAAGAAYTHWFVVGSYEVSLRDHWNRWMRWSVSCRTVRECYQKVHGRPPNPSWWVGGVALAAFVLVHIVFAALIVDGLSSLARIVPLFALDASLLGFFAGRRLVERLWYRRFLNSCNDLLRDGAIGLWGIY